MQSKVHCITISSERNAVFDLKGHLGAEVVHQVLADTRKMMNRLYPRLPQVVLGADAREHQQLGRSDRPRGQHHPVGIDLEHCPRAFGFDADGPAILDNDLADKYPTAHRQVQIVAHRVEMRQSGAHSDTFNIIRRCHTEAGGMQSVLVIRGAEPGLQTGSMKGLLDGGPGTRLTASDRHRPVGAMAIVVLNVEIVFRFAKVWHDLVVRPLIVAESRPGVEILRKSALHGLTVDRRPSPDHLALCDVDFALLLGDRAAQGPVVL